MQCSVCHQCLFFFLFAKNTIYSFIRKQLQSYSKNVSHKRAKHSSHSLPTGWTNTVVLTAWTDSSAAASLFPAGLKPFWLLWGSSDPSPRFQHGLTSYIDGKVFTHPQTKMNKVIESYVNKISIYLQTSTDTVIYGWFIQSLTRFGCAGDLSTLLNTCIFNYTGFFSSSRCKVNQRMCFQIFRVNECRLDILGQWFVLPSSESKLLTLCFCHS